MNEKLKFRLPTAEDAAEYISYRQAFLDAGSSMDGTGPMRRTADPMEWLAINAQYADPATVPEGKVQSTQFVCERASDGRIVGMLQVRLALCVPQVSLAEQRITAQEFHEDGVLDS